MTASTLVITRGLPGSGKTTWAKEQQMIAPEYGDNLARVNRDNLRKELYPERGQEFYAHPDRSARELNITKVQHERIRSLLLAGVDVVVDDTNLPIRRCRELMRIAEDTGSIFVEQRFELSPEQCISRQFHRPEDERVPENVIRDMHRRFFPLAYLPRESGLSSKATPYEGIEPYVRPTEYKRAAFIFDIDGTLATMVDRGPHEYHKLSGDEPNFVVQQVASALFSVGYVILLVSGRGDAHRCATQKWLKKHGIYGDDLFMRPEGDTRVDWRVKYDIFNQHIRDEYDVLGAFDDRDQVVNMWRKMGIQCFQVAPGDF